MFSSIRSRLKSLRRSDPDARIERKARNAAKDVTRTASRDLAQWEERNGFRRTNSSVANTNASGSESSKTLNERSRTVSDLRKLSSDYTTQRSRTVSDAKLSADTSFGSAGYNAVSQQANATLAPPSPTGTPTLAPPSPTAGLAARRSSSMPRLELQTLSLSDSSGGSTLADSMAPFGASQQQPQSQPQQPHPPRSDTPATPITPTTPRVSISNADQTLKELEEKEKLLAEIQKIRASIQHLKSAPTTAAAPNLTIDVNTSGAPARPKSRLSPIEPQQRQPAPWLTDDRASRPKSALGMSSSPRSPRSPRSPHSPVFVAEPTMASPSVRRRSVADIFAEDAPTPVSPRAPTPSGRRASVAPQLGDLPFASSSSSSSGSKAQPQSMQTTQSMQGMPTPSSPHLTAARPRTKSTSSVHSAAAQGRRRDTWRGEELPPLPTAAAATAAKVATASPTLPPPPPREEIPPRPKSRTESVYTQGGSRPRQQQRQIIDTPEEAKRRYSAALGRSSTPTHGRSTTPVNNGRSTTPTAGRPSSTTMTMAELQDRHLAKLRQLQSPATQKVREAEALSNARAEWERRTRLERQEQERKMRERADLARRQSQQQRPAMPSRRQTMSEDLLRSSAEQLQLAATPMPPPPAPVTTERRMSGARKAREWRKSLAMSEADPRMVALREADGGEEAEAADAMAATPAPPLPENAAQIAAASRTRAKSTLGLERPRARTPDVLSSMGAVSPTAAARRSSYFDPAMVQRSATPNGTPAAAPVSPATAAAPRPEKHRRQLTVTDIRRMQEGAGRRRSTVKVDPAGDHANANGTGMAARRMSQPLLDLETARATNWHPQWTQAV